MLSDLLIKLELLKWRNLAMALILIGANLVPYTKMYQVVFKPKEYSWDADYYRLTYFLRDKIQGGDHLIDHTLIDTMYCAHNKFYMNWMNYLGSEIDFAESLEEIQIGDRVIAHQTEINQEINARFEISLLEEYHNVKRYRIMARKDP